MTIAPVMRDGHGRNRTSQKMFPVLTVNDETDIGRGYSVSITEFPLRQAASRMQCADLKHLDFRQLRGASRFAIRLSLPALCDHICRVIGIRSQKEM